MKQTWKSLLVAGAMTFSMTGSAFAATPATLRDINNSYAKDQITQLYNAGIVSGDENHHFNPTGNMTRSQLAVLLTKALGLTPDATASAQFNDVADWAKPYVGALVKSGLTSGYDAHTFGGSDPVTREQLAIFFVRAFDATDLTNQLSLSGTTFMDDGTIDTYAKPSVALMQNLGFINGYSTNDGTEFNPLGHADRQAVAHLVSEFYFNKDTYTNKMNDMKKVDQILAQTADAMKSVQSFSLSIDDEMNMQDPSDASHSVNASEGATLDLTVAPLSSHGTGHVTGTVGGVDQPPVNTEFYLANDMLYYQDATGKWMKMASPVTTQDITDALSGDPSAYHELATEFKVTGDTADAYTLTSTPTEEQLAQVNPAIGIGNTTVTVTIDKHTNLLSSIKMTTSANNIPADTITISITNYNKVQPITVPQTVLDSATLVQDPTQDPTQDQTPDPAMELSHVAKLLSR